MACLQRTSDCAEDARNISFGRHGHGSADQGEIKPRLSSIDASPCKLHVEHVCEFCSMQGEVRKLCTKERIASEIITNERDEYEEKERRRMIARAAQEQEQVCASKSIPLHELTRVRSDPTVSVVFMWSSRGLYCWELRIFAHHFLREKMCIYFSATL